jgi:putative FmdB family regulatory protein
MPVYEFYCPDCHAVFQFLSRSINTRTRPDCPRCGRKRLGREVSRFAITGKAAAPGDAMDGMPFDEAKMMEAMSAIEREADGIDEDNPREAANLVRRLADSTGMPLGPAMNEALCRMEAGEDPESVESDLGDRLDAEDPFQAPTRIAGAIRRMRREPDRDPELYEM